MKSSLVVWGIVMLVAFAGANWLLAMQLLAESWIWVALAIIILVMNFWVGKTMKKMPKESEALWMALSVFGFITTLAVAFGVVPVPLWWLMSLWLLLMGAAIGVGGYLANNGLNMFLGVVMLFASLSVAGFAGAYLLSGALFFGFLGIVHGYFVTGE